MYISNKMANFEIDMAKIIYCYLSSAFILAYKKDGLYTCLSIDYSVIAVDALTQIINDFLITGDLEKSVKREIDMPTSAICSTRLEKINEDAFFDLRHDDNNSVSLSHSQGKAPTYAAINYILFDFDLNKIIVPDYSIYLQEQPNFSLKVHDSIEVGTLFDAYKYIVEYCGSYLPKFYKKFTEENKVIAYNKVQIKTVDHALFSTKFIYRDFAHKSQLHEAIYYECCSQYDECNCTSEQLKDHKKNYYPF